MGSAITISISDALTQRPFGMLMVGRNFDVGSGYRYGFAGKEVNKDIEPTCITLDFGLRIYNSSLGKWFTTDPYDFRYPDLSPYSYVANSPIHLIDVKGGVIRIMGEEPCSSLNALVNSFFLNREVVLSSTWKDGIEVLEINLGDHITEDMLTKQQKAIYTLVKSMIDAQKMYTIYVEQGNDNALDPDSYTTKFSQDQNYIKPNNILLLPTSGGYAQMELVFHFFMEQKLKQDEKINYRSLTEAQGDDYYEKHHDQTMQTQLKDMGFAWTVNIESPDGKMRDMDIYTEGNKYVGTMRLNVNEDGSVTSFIMYNRDGLKPGDVIDPKYYFSIGYGDDTVEKTKEHFEKNKAE